MISQQFVLAGKDQDRRTRQLSVVVRRIPYSFHAELQRQFLRDVADRIVVCHQQHGAAGLNPIAHRRTLVIGECRLILTGIGVSFPPRALSITRIRYPSSEAIEKAAESVPSDIIALNQSSERVITVPHDVDITIDLVKRAPAVRFPGYAGLAMKNPTAPKCRMFA
jgi:hypothetical protein